MSYSELNKCKSPSLVGEEERLEKEYPLVSVIIPCYNHEKYVLESIQSIVNQDYENIELIVIDDGSLDQSVEKIESLVDVCKKRFVRFEFKARENRGLSRTLNEGLDWFKGEYFCGLASDDLFLPNKISILIQEIKSQPSECVVVFGDVSFIDANSGDAYLEYKTGNLVKKNTNATNSFLDFYAEGIERKSSYFASYRNLIQGNFLPAMGYLMRTRVMREVEGWTPSNAIEDWEMWLKITKSYKMKYVDVTVAKYRLHGLNTIYTSQEKLAVSTLEILDKERKYAYSTGLKKEFDSKYYSTLIDLVRLRSPVVLSRYYYFITPSFYVFIFTRLIGRLRLFV